jgi:hypothetical protein
MPNASASATLPQTPNNHLNGFFKENITMGAPTFVDAVDEIMQLIRNRAVDKKQLRDRLGTLVGLIIRDFQRDVEPFMPVRHRACNRRSQSKFFNLIWRLNQFMWPLANRPEMFRIDVSDWHRLLALRAGFDACRAAAITIALELLVGRLGFLQWMLRSGPWPFSYSRHNISVLPLPLAAFRFNSKWVRIGARLQWRPRP